MDFEDGRLRVVGIGGTLREGSRSLAALRRALGAAGEAGAEVEFLARDGRPYLDGKVVGLISTAGGDQAAAHTTDAMVHVVHALRGVVAPLTVAIPRAWRLMDEEGRITDENYGRRLDRLGRLVVELAEKVSPAQGIRSVENVGIVV